MGISKASLLGLVVAGAALAGCQTGGGGGDYAPVSPPPPAPLAAAPSGAVQKSDLSQPNPSQFPTAPTNGPDAQGGTQVASLPPANAPDLTPGAVAGVWNASLGGQSCKIATPQTKYGQGYRAGPLRCPGELANLSSWSVSGKQLTLFDSAGGAVATLHSTGQGRFNGQTAGGQSVSLSR